jgi:hypothetical protein
LQGIRLGSLKTVNRILKFRIEFNAEKPDLVLFNWKGPLPDEIVLGK